MIVDGDMQNLTNSLPQSVRQSVSMNWMGTRNLTVFSNLTLPMLLAA